MTMKEALKKVQKDLESAQAELSKLYDLVDPDGHFKMPHLWPGQNAPATGLS
jgi:hypothetical protein